MTSPIESKERKPDPNFNDVCQLCGLPLVTGHQHAGVFVTRNAALPPVLSPRGDDEELKEALQTYEDAIRLVGSSRRDDINDRYDEEYYAAKKSVESLFGRIKEERQGLVDQTEHLIDDIIALRAEVERINEDHVKIIAAERAELGRIRGNIHD